MFDTKDISEWHEFPFLTIVEIMKTRRPTMTQRNTWRNVFLGWQASIWPGKYWIANYGGSHNFMQFCDYKMTPDEQQQALAWYDGDLHKVMDEANLLVASGYRFAFSEDKKAGCFIASIMGKDEGNPNFGFCMTTRHGSVEMAFVLCVFKQTVLMGGEGWDKGPSENDWG